MKRQAFLLLSHSLGSCFYRTDEVPAAAGGGGGVAAAAKQAVVVR